MGIKLTDSEATEILERAELDGIEIMAKYDDDSEYIKEDAIQILLEARENRHISETARKFYIDFEEFYEDVPETIAKREKLPLPTFVHIEALPEMPPDLTVCSDEEIRKLHSQFHAYQVRTNWLEGIQENKVKVAQHNFKQAYNVEMLKIDAFFREGNRAPKEKTKAYIEAEIMQNKSVLAKKEELLALEADLAELKTLADIYESNVSRLSRESSMRYAERG